MIVEKAMSSHDQKFSLAGSVSLGTGVMIGAGIFALVGQVAGLAGDWFPLAFLESSDAAVQQCVLSARPPTGPNVPPTRSGDQWLYVDADEVGSVPLRRRTAMNEARVQPIVVGVDGSDGSIEALRKAVEIAAVTVTMNRALSASSAVDRGGAE